MKIDILNLKRHLQGHDIPKSVQRKVIDLFTLLLEQPEEAVYKSLNPIRSLLDIAANSPQLDLQQSAVVRRCYLTLYGGPSILHQQLEKDRDAIQNRTIQDADVATLWPTISLGLRGIAKAGLKLKASRVKPIYELLWTKFSKETPYAKDQRNKHTETVVQRSQKRLAVELQAWMNLPDHIKSLGIWEQVFLGVNLNAVKLVNTNKHVGNIGVTQEPGMKLRLFASPFLLYQAALEPLKIALKRALGEIDQDCHRDQEEGADWAQKQLKQGFTVHSFDLSSATHRFPWKVQVQTMRHLGVPEVVIMLYDHVAKGSYKFQDESFAWAQGQPLGSGPSFFSFSLAHHALIRGICRELRQELDCYRILGDDIVISNDQVAKRYEKLMRRLGTHINAAKSRISTTVAEFAGFEIYSDVKFRTGKLRPVTQTNWLDYGRIWRNPAALTGSQQGVMEGFKEFTTSSESNPLHDYVNRVLSAEAAKLLETPSGVPPADFATTVTSITDYPDPNRRAVFSQHYANAVGRLADDVTAYLPDNHWVNFMPKPSSRIRFGIDALLRELALCPTQCCPTWGQELMDRVGKRYGFLQTRRELFKICTALQLNRPPAWVISSPKFAQKVNTIWRRGLRLESLGLLGAEVQRLEQVEAQMLANNYQSGDAKSHLVIQMTPTETYAVKTANSG